MRNSNLAAQTSSYLSYYNLVLTLGATERRMGRVSHLQIFELPAGTYPEQLTNIVRFCDGGTHRELSGKLHVDEEGACFRLDMGEGKIYRFEKLRQDRL